MEHVSVMLNQCIELLNIKADGIYVDGTLGRAGHSSSILSRLSSKGHLYCFDIDDEAIQQSNKKLKKMNRMANTGIKDEEFKTKIGQLAE